MEADTSSLGSAFEWSEKVGTSEYFDKLYELYPDNKEEALKKWHMMSPAQKKEFRIHLDEQDAADEGNERAFMKWIKEVKSKTEEQMPNEPGHSLKDGNPVYLELLGKIKFMTPRDAAQLKKDIDTAWGQGDLTANQATDVANQYKIAFGTELKDDAMKDFSSDDHKPGEFCIHLSKSEKRALSMIVADKLRSTAEDHKDYKMIEDLFDRLIESKKN